MAVTKSALMALTKDEMSQADMAESIIDNYLTTYYRGQRKDNIPLPMHLSMRVIDEVTSRYGESGFRMKFVNDSRVAGTVVEIS